MRQAASSAVLVATIAVPTTFTFTRASMLATAWQSASAGCEALQWRFTAKPLG